MQFSLGASGSYSVHIGTIDIMDADGFNLVTAGLNEAMQTFGAIGSTGFREAVEALGGTFEPGVEWPTFILPAGARFTLSYHEDDGYARHTVAFEKRKNKPILHTQFVEVENDLGVPWVEQPFGTSALQLLKIERDYYLVLTDGAGSSFVKKFHSRDDAKALFLVITLTMGLSFSKLERDGFKCIEGSPESNRSFINF